MKKRLLFTSVVAASALCAAAFTIDWDRIVYWAGTGENRAALVVQFNDGKEEKAYIWGYRWSADSKASGEDMFRAVAAASPDLILFTQYTGWMGSTVDGIGYSPRQIVAENLAFDFNGAMNDPRISFDYFSANTSMGQTEVPGDATQDLCDASIAASLETHIVEHPINARIYGYPAYDYDYWQMIEKDDPEQRWNAGWYDGYWSYWISDGDNTDSDYYGYSGLGMTSRMLENNSVDAWKYMLLDGPVTHAPGRQPKPRADTASGATAPWYELDYEHFGIPQESKVHIPGITPGCAAIFTIQGTKIRNLRPDESLKEATDALPKGIYVVKAGQKQLKIIK